MLLGRAKGDRFRRGGISVEFGKTSAGRCIAMSTEQPQQRVCVTSASPLRHLATH